jgi:dienelactone hydrolase
MPRGVYMRNLYVIWIMILSVLSFAASASAKSKIDGKTVEYSSGNVVMKGYLVYDKNIKGKRPGVLVVHEWWGLNDYVRKRARMLAEMGYAALAVDMYGGGREAIHPDEAGKLSSELMQNFDTAKAR